MNYNSVTLAGHMVRDPDLSYNTQQTAIANFSIAVNYKTANYEETSFIDCVAFGKLAENITKYFTKGKPIFLTGRMKQDRWDADDGSKRQKIRVMVNEFRFVGTAGGSGDNNNPTNDEGSKDW